MVFQSASPALSADDDDSPSPQNEDVEYENHTENGKSESKSSDDALSNEKKEPDNPLNEFSFFTEGFTGKFKAQFNKFSAEKQKTYSRNDMNLRVLLRLDRNQIYTVEDLRNEMTLERALRLLFDTLYGHDNIFNRISP